MKKIASLSAVLTLLLGSVSLVYAQTSSTATQATIAHVESDFGQDLQEGEQSTANDEEAQKNQHDAKDNEDVGVNEEGEMRNGQQEVDQQDLFESQDELNQDEGGDNGGAPLSDEHDSKGEHAKQSDSVSGDNSSEEGTTTQMDESSDSFQQGGDNNQ